MKEIELIGGALTKVDDQDYAELKALGKWYLNNDGYAVNNQSKMLLHCVLMQPPLHLEVDHKDLDKLNNQRNNLRLATFSQNRANRSLQKNNTSGYKGVVLDKRVGKWGARIKVNGKTKSLGYYTTPEEAAERYNRAASFYYGEFARLNELPQTTEQNRQ